MVFLSDRDRILCFNVLRWDDAGVASLGSLLAMLYGPRHFVTVIMVSRRQLSNTRLEQYDSSTYTLTD